MQLGDYVRVSMIEDNENEALKQYREMAEYANRMGYVIEKKEIDVYYMDDPVPYEEWVYMICEPPKPEPPTRRDELEAERMDCKQWFRELGGHDDMAIKCSVLGLDFTAKYPELFNEGVAKRARINEIERELEEIDRISAEV